MGPLVTGLLPGRDRHRVAGEMAMTVVIAARRGQGDMVRRARARFQPVQPAGGAPGGMAARWPLLPPASFVQFELPAASFARWCCTR